MPLAVFALSLAAFCIGTTEFIISGILFGVSADLGVTVPVAGLLVTGYAAGVAVGGPILALLTARVPVKPAILGVIALFAAGQVLCALAPTYELLLAARLISACGHGLFFGVGTVAVSQLVPEARRGAALSLMVGGITVANILGLPAGTAIGNAYGWRAAFVVIAVMAVLAFAAVALALPARTRNEEEADAPLRLQARQLLRQEVWLSFLTTIIIMIGQLAFSTFQVAILTEVTKVDPAVMVPLYLLIGGAGAVVGIWLGGRAADRNGNAAIIGVISGQIVCFVVLLLGAANPVVMAVTLFFSSAFGFGFSTPVQLRVLHGARAAPRLAVTLLSAAYNIGIATGAAAGAALLTAGVSYALLPATGIVSSSIALVTALVSITLSRRGIA